MKLSTMEQKVSYGYGRNIAYQFAEFLDKIDFDALLEGLKDGRDQAPLPLPPEEIDAAYQEFNEQLAKAREEKLSSQTKANADYLDENAKKPGVITTESGLQYEVLNEGTGRKPTKADKVRVHYHGTLVNGDVFDSSVARNDPAEFGVTQVIKGWVEGLQLMNEGSKYKFTIPAHLAYGDQAVGSIPPRSVLVFEVELLKVL